MAWENKRFVPGATMAMVVDDEMFSRFVETEILQSLGLPTPLTAHTGAEALALLSRPEARGVDLVLLDFNMPPPNGIEVLQHIRCGRLEVAHDVMVLLASGVEGFGLVAAAVALDIDGLLFKPVGAEHLRGLLDDLAREERDINTPEHYAAIDVSGLTARPLVVPASGQVATIALAELTPGMIMADDLYSPLGELLVAAGTRVNDRLIRLLRGLGAAGVPLAPRVLPIT